MSEPDYMAWLGGIAAGQPPADPFRDTLGPIYQKSISVAERRKTGQYYTPEWLADMALDAAGYDGSGALIDPACGSGVFLLRALARRPDALVAGYETNPIAHRIARIQWSWAASGTVENAPISLRDSICDSGEQRFDFVVGNPPWVNWRNLDHESRERLAPIWQGYGLFPHRGLRARLGAGMDDLSALATYVWADRLAREDGRIALVLPQALLQSAGGGAGFRRFELPGGRFLRVLSVRDFDTRQCFPGAATRAAVVVLTVSRARTVFPVPYTRGDAECEATPVSPECGAPWAIVRRGLAASLERMRGNSAYRARVGIHSGGAAGVFWVDVLERAGGLVRIANRANAGRNKFEQVEAWVEAPLLRRLLRGRDVERWKAEPSAHIVLPYQARNSGKALSESELRANYPRTFDYFERFRGALTRRAHYLHHFSDKDPPWSLYNTGDYTFVRDRVVWREQSSVLRAAVLSDPDTVADAKLTVVACESEPEARYLAAILNSSPARAFVESYAIKTQISTHVLRYMAVPRFDSTNPMHAQLAASHDNNDAFACDLWGIDAGVFSAADQTP
jgi:N-6 DNA Methylase